MTKQELYEGLSEFITEKRKGLFDSIGGDRTRHITIALEDIYQSQNASAVLRTCDLCGIQDVHVIENRNRYKVNRDVSLGSSKWISLNRYSGSQDPLSDCVNTLKRKGYRIIATSPKTEKSFSLNELNLEQPIAIMFGTELDGLTDEAFALADERMHVPMHGFTESYNISVCAAIVLYTLTQRMRATHTNWALTEEEQLTLKIDWTKKMLRNAEEHERKLREKND